MVPLRFEVMLNGRLLCTAGMDQEGVLLVTVQAEDWPGPEEDASTRGTPRGEENMIVVNGLADTDEELRWSYEKIAAGDEIRIRVLPSGPFDPPTEVVPCYEGHEDEVAD